MTPRPPKWGEKRGRAAIGQVWTRSGYMTLPFNPPSENGELYTGLGPRGVGVAQHPFQGWVAWRPPPFSSPPPGTTVPAIPGGNCRQVQFPPLGALGGPLSLQPRLLHGLHCSLSSSHVRPATGLACVPNSSRWCCDPPPPKWGEKRGSGGGGMQRGP